MSGTNKIVIVTVAWGDWHLNALKRTTIASLLASGNLPAFVKNFDVSYYIHLRKSEAAGFIESPAYRQLSELVDLHVETTVPEINDGDPFKLHHIAWHRGIAKATELGALVMFMPPDVVFADDSWSFLLKPLRDGKKSIMWTYSRVIEETVLQDLNAPEYWPSSDQLVISKRDLVEISFKHFHPLMASSMIGAENFVQHPEMILWPVPGEGLLMRILASVNAIYDPSYFQLNENNLLDGALDPDDILMIDDSDQLFAISLGPLTKDSHWYCTREKAAYWKIGRWWLDFDSPSNDFVASHKIRIHTQDISEQKWRGTELSSDLTLTRAAYYREIHRVATQLIKRGEYLILAGLIEEIGLSKKIPLYIKPGQRFILLATPNNYWRAALDRTDGIRAHKSKSSEFFIEMLKLCVPVPDGLNAETLMQPGNTLVSFSGMTYMIERSGAHLIVGDFRISRPALEIGNGTIYLCEVESQNDASNPT